MDLEAERELPKEPNRYQPGEDGRHQGSVGSWVTRVCQRKEGESERRDGEGRDVQSGSQPELAHPHNSL